MGEFEYDPTDPSKIQGVPRGILPHVSEFCRTISPAQPFFIVMVPGEDDGQLDCVNNVRRRIEKQGGEAVLGWQIWEWYGVLIEAEFHMLWRRSDGQLVDVTPKPVLCDKVLFLPDSALTYAECQINNKRAPLVDDPRVSEFITLANEDFQIMNAGDRAEQYAVELSVDETNRRDWIEWRRAMLQMALMHAVPGRNQLCRCGSGEKYKRCHGR